MLLLLPFTPGFFRVICMPRRTSGRVGVAGEARADGGNVAVREQRSGGGDGTGGSTDGVVGISGSGDEGEGGRVLSSISRVGCAAKVVQMGRVAGSDSFKVGARWTVCDVASRRVACSR